MQRKRSLQYLGLIRGNDSPYGIFVKESYREQKDKYPEKQLDVKEISKNCSDQWKAMTDEQKSPYIELGKRDLERYAMECTAYDVHTEHPNWTIEQVWQEVDRLCESRSDEDESGDESSSLSSSFDKCVSENSSFYGERLEEPANDDFTSQLKALRSRVKLEKVRHHNELLSIKKKSDELFTKLNERYQQSNDMLKTLAKNRNELDELIDESSTFTMTASPVGKIRSPIISPRKDKRIEDCMQAVIDENFAN